MGVANWFLILMALAFVNSVVAAFGLKGFISAHPSIDSPQALENFKQTVRMQMYQTLVQICFLGIANVVGFYGIFTGRVNLLLVVFVNVLIIILSKAMKGNEERARNMEVADKELKSRYDDVCESWVKKALPDF